MNSVGNDQTRQRGSVGKQDPIRRTLLSDDKTVVEDLLCRCVVTSVEGTEFGVPRTGFIESHDQFAERRPQS